MSGLARYALGVTFLLLVAIGVIAYLIEGANKGISDPEHQAVIAAIKEADAASEAALIKRQKAEMDTIEKRLAEALAKANRERQDHAAALDAQRKAYLAAAARTRAALAFAIAAASDGHTEEVSTDDDSSVHLSKKEALAIISHSKRLNDELALCNDTCAVKLADLRAQIEPRLVLERQAVERQLAQSQGEVHLLGNDRDYYKRLANAEHANVVKWALLGTGFGIIGGGAIVGATWAWYEATHQATKVQVVNTTAKTKKIEQRRPGRRK